MVPFSDILYMFGVNEAWQLIRMTSELALTVPPQASMAAWGGGVMMGRRVVMMGSDDGEEERYWGEGVVTGKRNGIEEEW